jgi:hypothetical protein
MAQSIISELYSKTPELAYTDVRTAMFADPANRTHLLSENDLSGTSNMALKYETGDPLSVNHSLRHLFFLRIQCHIYKRLLVTNQGEAISATLALSAESSTQLDQFVPNFAQYPFWNFRLGRWGGHADEETGLVVYSHATWFIVSGCCRRIANQAPISAGLAAALLGFSRRTVVTWLNATAADNTSAAALNEMISNHVMSSALIPALDLEVTSQVVPTKPSAVPMATASIQMVDALLCLRRKFPNPLEAFDDFGRYKLKISTTLARRWRKAYAKAVHISGMLDFEPPQNLPAPWKSMGVAEGQQRRHRLLEALQARVSTFDQGARKIFQENVDLLLENLDPRQPFLVCHGIKALQQLVQWIDDVGYQRSNLVVHTFGATDTDIDWLYQSKLTAIPVEKPPGRVRRIDGATTFALEIKDSTDLPEGRDLLRAVLALAIWIHMSII